MVIYDREGYPVFNGIPEAHLLASGRVKRWGPNGPERRPSPPTPREVQKEVQKMLPRPSPKAPPREPLLWPISPEVRQRSRLRALGLTVIFPETPSILRRLRA